MRLDREALSSARCPTTENVTSELFRLGDDVFEVIANGPRVLVLRNLTAPLRLHIADLEQELAAAYRALTDVRQAAGGFDGRGIN